MLLAELWPIAGTTGNYNTEATLMTRRGGLHGLSSSDIYLMVFGCTFVTNLWQSAFGIRLALQRLAGSNLTSRTCQREHVPSVLAIDGNVVNFERLHEDSPMRPSYNSRERANVRIAQLRNCKQAVK